MVAWLDLAILWAIYINTEGNTATVGEVTNAGEQETLLYSIITQESYQN